SRSTKGRSSFAFGTVVSMSSCRRSAIAWLRSIARRCSVTRPSFRCATLCLMVAFRQLPARSCLLPLILMRLRRLVEPHPEAQAHAMEDLLDLVQRLAAEVLRLEHFGLGLLHELADSPDVRVLQTVVRPHRDLELLDALVEVLVERAGARLVGLRLLRLVG